MTHRPTDNNSQGQPREDKRGCSVLSRPALALMTIPLCVMLTLPQPSHAAGPPISLTAPQAVASVPVQISVQGNKTRVIFSFPALTAYTAAQQADGSISFDFRTAATFDAPAGKNEDVLSFNATRPDSDTTRVTLKLAEGATHRHYRLQKRVVVEITRDKPAPVAEKKPEAPAVKPPAKVTDKITGKAAEKPASTPAAKPPAATADKTPAAKGAPQMPAVPAPVVEAGNAATQAAIDAAKTAASPAFEKPSDNTPTHITLSTLEPARIAVFSRFDTLWIVLDSSLSGAQLPEIKGPLAMMADKPKVQKFGNATSFRYKMPKDYHLSVRKQNIGWDISMTPYPVQGTSEQQANVEFDGEKAKLVIPLKGSGRIIEVQDPDIGDKIFVVPSNQSDTRIDQARSFANLEIIPAAAGLALRPLSDDIKLNRIEDFVLVTSKAGVLATPAISAGPAMVFDTDRDDTDQRRLFDFPNWRQGGLPRLNQNAALLEKQIAMADSPEARSENMMKLALLYFANNMGQESLGALRILETDYPETAKNPNFIALRGAANAMAGHYTEALQDLSNAALQQHPEVSLWVGYVAAATEQWHMANQSFPKDNQLLVQYPENIAVPITIYMAESSLRLGRTQSAAALLDTLNLMATAKDPHYSAAIAYLRGEVARQEGRHEDAIRIWKDTASGLDRLYHTKASLALANIELQEKKISAQDAIDRIDSLRFAWRGDGLEVQILHNLGLLKTQAGKYLEGLQDMRTAAKLAASLMADEEPINADVTSSFNSIFSGDAPVKITPIEAVSVYNEFGDLIPPADAGALVHLEAADFMISMDLLEKAEQILEKTIADGFIPADKIATTGAKLAAVYLIDSRPTQAIEALDKTASSAMDETQKESRALLRARAQSELNLVDQATETLKPYSSADAQRLKVDLLWKAKQWTDAANAISPLLPEPSAKSLTPEEADLVINAAVACKLGNNSACLQNMRSRYGTLMAATKQATTFNVVTRDGGMSSLSDRETIMKIAGETDLFRQFLDSYKSADVVTPAAAPAPSAAPAVPAQP